MIYYFFNNYNITQYISFRAAGAAITALIICFLIGPKIIRTLNSHSFSETIRKNGPDSHLKKEGTPSMGGVIILIAIILPTILWAKIDNLYIITILVSTIWMGIIGYIDDFLKIKKKYSKGLIARYKLIGQVLLGIFISYMIYETNMNYFIIGLNNSYNLIDKSSISLPFIANGFALGLKEVAVIPAVPQEISVPSDFKTEFALPFVSSADAALAFP